MQFPARRLSCFIIGCSLHMWLKACSHCAIFSDCDCNSSYRNKWVVQDSMEVLTLCDCNNITNSYVTHNKQKPNCSRNQKKKTHSVKESYGLHFWSLWVGRWRELCVYVWLTCELLCVAHVWATQAELSPLDILKWYPFALLWSSGGRHANTLDLSLNGVQ